MIYLVIFLIIIIKLFFCHYDHFNTLFPKLVHFIYIPWEEN